MPGNFFTMPGIDEQIGPALQSLTNSIGSIRDPKYAVRQALNDALDKDYTGELHQALIDKGPDFLNQIYGGKTAQKYGTGKISNEEQVRRDDAAQLASLTPEQRAERNAERFKFRTPEARALDKANATKGTSEAKVQIQTEGDQVTLYHNKAKAADVEMKDLEAMVKANPNIADINTRSMASDMAKGKSIDPMKWARLPKPVQDAITQASGNLHDFTMESMRYGHQVSLEKMRESSHEVKSQLLIGMNQQVDNLTGQYKALDASAKNFLEGHRFLGIDLMAKGEARNKLSPERLKDIADFTALKKQRDDLLPQITDWTSKSGDYLLELAGKEKSGAIKDTSLIPDSRDREAVDHFKELSPKDAKIEFEHLKVLDPSAANRIAHLVGQTVSETKVSHEAILAPAVVRATPPEKPKPLESYDIVGQTRARNEKINAEKKKAQTAKEAKFKAQSARQAEINKKRFSPSASNY